MNIQKQFHKFAIFNSNFGITSFSNTKSFTFTPILFFIKEQNKYNFSDRDNSHKNISINWAFK